MSNLRISLKRLSIEEIEIATGRKFKEEPKKQKHSENTHGTKKKANKENIANPKKKGDEVLSRSEKSAKSGKKIDTQQSNQCLANSNEKAKTKRSVENKLSHKHQSTNLATAGESKTRKENENSKSVKRRIEISESEINIKPNPKRQKLEKNQYATELVSERVTRSMKRAQQPSETQSNGTESNETKSNENIKHAKEKNSKCHITSGSKSSKVLDSKKDDEKRSQVAVLDFKVGEVIWAKIRGYPGWPARIEQISGEKRLTYRVYWFNDYRTSTVFKSQIFKFHPNFEQYAKEFQSHIGLETAAREALIYLARTENK